MRGLVARLTAGAAVLTWGAAASALDFTLGVGPTFNCASAGVAAHAAAIAYLEPAPVLRAGDYGGTHYDPSDGNNVGVGAGYADVTAPVGKYCLGIFYRIDYRGSASRDALDALVQNRRRQPFDVGRLYRLDAQSWYFDGVGVKVSRVFPFEPARGWSVQFGLTGSVMKAFTNHDDWIHGSAVATSGDYAVGTASYVRARSDFERKDFNPYVKTGNPTGYGYSVDVGLLVGAPHGFIAEFTVMDAYSYLDWSDLPTSTQRIDNQTVRYDVNFNRQAVVQGRDFVGSVGQRIDPRYRAAVWAPLKGRFTMVASDDYVRSTHFPAMGLRYGSGHQVAQVDYDFQTQAVGLTVGWDWFNLSVSSNNLDLHDATVLGAQLGFTSSW